MSPRLDVGLQRLTVCTVVRGALRIHRVNTLGVAAGT